jgi:hypothetical protein
MTRIVLLALLLGALLTGAASKDGGFMKAIWDSAGAEGDPFGSPPVQPTIDAGCEWDPDGRCHPGS